jgi:hypothetical protein
MPKAKTIATTCVALVATMALAAGTASAAGWHVNGTELTGSQTAAQAKTATMDVAAVLNTPSLPLKIACKGTLDAVSPQIEAPDLAAATSLTFTECAVAEPTTCSLPSPEIKTEPIEETINTATAPADHIVLKTTAKRFAEFTLQGTACTLEGKKAITGKVVFNAGAGQTEASIQKFEGLGTLEQGTNSMQVANDDTYFEGGKMLLKLESSSKWSFH